MRNAISFLQKHTRNETVSPWVAEQLIMAFSDGDDVLQRTHAPEELVLLDMCIAHDLTQIRLINEGVIL